MDLERISLRFSENNKDELKLYKKIKSLREKTGISYSQVIKRAAYKALFPNG